MNEKFNPTWESLKNCVFPQWLRDVKFGIYTHWGVYSVPACPPNATWYPYNMYRKGTEQYNHHVKTYGDPSEFGYKDFIPMFKAENFDADEWAEIFKKSGAGFAGPVAEHHDGFAMWDTAYGEWNAAKMGPKRDVVAELEKAIRKQGMKFFTALHHFENNFFYPHWHKDYDTSNPKYAGLYGLPHDTEATRDLDFGGQAKPGKEAHDIWLGKTKEIIDRFMPDAMWFDFGLRWVQEHYKREMLAYYYNIASEAGKEVCLMYKFNDLVAGTGMIDLEEGHFAELVHNEWITDTTVDLGGGWGYLFNATYKSPQTILHYLIDNVSKNGYLVLNVGPKANGEIPDEAKHILNEMGKWLSLNGESIYGTSPWLYSGEGPTKQSKSGGFTESEVLQYTCEDFRYTAKGENIYAICLAWSDSEYIMKQLGGLYPGEIAKISMLGIDKPLAWTLKNGALVVESPKIKPCEYAYVLKIERTRPF